jgi:hypothetical protein
MSPSRCARVLAQRLDHRPVRVLQLDGGRHAVAESGAVVVLLRERRLVRAAAERAREADQRRRYEERHHERRERQLGEDERDRGSGEQRVEEDLHREPRPVDLGPAGTQPDEALSHDVAVDGGGGARLFHGPRLFLGHCVPGWWH